jgi:hypothetical protein
MSRKGKGRVREHARGEAEGVPEIQNQMSLRHATGESSLHRREPIEALFLLISG